MHVHREGGGREWQGQRERELDLEDKFWSDQHRVGSGCWWTSCVQDVIDGVPICHFIHAQGIVSVFYETKNSIGTSSSLPINSKTTVRFAGPHYGGHYSRAASLWDQVWHTDPTWQYRQREASEQDYLLTCWKIQKSSVIPVDLGTYYTTRCRNKVLALTLLLVSTTTSEKQMYLSLSKKLGAPETNLEWANDTL